MTIKLEMITNLLKNNNIEVEVIGDVVSANRLAAIGPDLIESVCYYVGDDQDHLSGIKKSIIFCRPDYKLNTHHENTFIKTKHPQLCFYLVSSLADEIKKPDISNQSCIDEYATIGKSVSIGPFCTIEKCVIGNNVVIESGVKIHRNTIIGNDVHIQANTVIGAIGVMWAWDSAGKKVRCYQSGHVIIKDNVFIGSNISIARGAFENSPTVIGSNTMIAHGTMIGHGVIIGYSNHFANNVAIGGSVKTGRTCFFGSGSTVRPHIMLMDNTTVGAGAVVVKDTATKGLTLVGCPAKSLESNNKKQSGIPSPYSS